MRKLQLTLVTALAAGLAAVVLTGPASASPRLAAAGTFTEDSFILTFVKEAGGNVFYRYQDVHTYTGTFTGTDAFDGSVGIRKDGTISWHGTSTFTGTVAGCGAGTVVFEAVGGADGLTCPAQCHQERIAGTLPLHGSLDLVGVLPSFTYGGSYSCY